MPSPGPLLVPPAPSAGRAWFRWPVLLLLAAAVVFGASRLAFLCDDAYIHFRYAANAYDGHGLVWNQAPFAPVEGAGFLWVLVLWALWVVTGAAPPEAANPFSIGCGLVQFALLAAAFARLRHRDGRPLPAAVGLFALAVVVGNRSFLQWMSSGLDTALFNMWLLWWVLHACRGPAQRGPRWLGWWSVAAALAALTRPDGLPLACATAGVAAWAWLRREATAAATAKGLAPLLAVVALTCWRRAYYGEWLPNTYFAKVVAAWPEAGWRYFACFALEHGAWLWFPLVLAWALRELCRGPRAVLTSVLAHVPAAAAVVVVSFNACYYLFKVGGDHFEYRVLSQLVPLGTLACVAMALRLTDGWRLPVATSAALALGSSVGWFHLAWTSEARAEGVAAITPHVPRVLRPLAQWYDQQQVWLFFRYIGLRCNHHAARLESLRTRFPARVRLPAGGEPFPIRAESAVGLPGWCLPDVALIDVFGLNDWVVARTPVHPAAEVPPERIAAAVQAADRDGDGWLAREELRDALGQALGARPDDGFGMIVLRLFWSIHCPDGGERVTLAQARAIAGTISFARRMAHERLPPPGYVEAFAPNVDVDDAGRVTVRPRAEPMTAERIRAIEAEWRGKVRTGELGR